MRSSLPGEGAGKISVTVGFAITCRARPLLTPCFPAEWANPSTRTDLFCQTIASDAKVWEYRAKSRSTVNIHPLFDGMA